MNLEQLQSAWGGFLEVVRSSHIKALQFMEGSDPIAMLSTPPSEEEEMTLFLTIALLPDVFEEVSPIHDEDIDHLNRATGSAVAALLEAYLGLPWQSIQISFVSGAEPPSEPPPAS